MIDIKVHAFKKNSEFISTYTVSIPIDVDFYERRKYLTDYLHSLEREDTIFFSTDKLPLIYPFMFDTNYWRGGLKNKLTACEDCGTVETYNLEGFYKTHKGWVCVYCYRKER